MTGKNRKLLRTSNASGTGIPLTRRASIVPTYKNALILRGSVVLL